MMRIKNFVMIAFMLGTLRLTAQDNDKLQKMATDDSSRLVAIFKDIHSNPELGFMEVRTAAIVEKELKKLGYQVLAGIGKTGIVGILRNGRGPIVMYRADMDCNSVKEATGLPYASTRTTKKEDGSDVPVMHACGHDAHVAWLLGIARIMAGLRSQWQGTLIFVAQPAEELLRGASAMIEDGLYKGKIPEPDILLAMHTWPSAVGTVFNGVGERSAGSDQLDVIFYGVAGHGSAPDRAKDPLLMACTAVLQYQSIVSRHVPPQDVCVLTVSSFQAGSDYNVIPGSVTMKMNLRWFKEETRKILLDGIANVNKGIAIANNLPPDLYPQINMKGIAYPLHNDTTLTNKINLRLSKVLPSGSLHTNMPPIMGSEDFPMLGKHNKTAIYDYIFIGIANPDTVRKANENGERYPFFHHSPNYIVDLSAIPKGTLIGATALLETFR